MLIEYNQALVMWKYTVTVGVDLGSYCSWKLMYSCWLSLLHALQACAAAAAADSFVENSFNCLHALHGFSSSCMLSGQSVQTVQQLTATVDRVPLKNSYQVLQHYFPRIVPIFVQAATSSPSGNK